MISSLTVFALAIPSKPHYFRNLVDHFSASSATYVQRYYINDTAWRGPGSPILLIVGGEGAIPPSTGLFYPFVVDVLAPLMGALVLQPEHRFYGQSLPLGNSSLTDAKALELLTPQQALADTVRLIRAEQTARNCSYSRRSSSYCAVFTVGGSYPGWLSAMLRLRYPAVVDGAYAASAPIRIYAQQVSQYAYYTVVTKSAERARQGCAAHVLAALQLIAAADVPTLVQKLQICQPLPDYVLRGGVAMLRDELLMVYAYSFAGLNMANYPPGAASALTHACKLFSASVSGPDAPSHGDEVAAGWTALRAFLLGYVAAAHTAHGLPSVSPTPTSSADAAGFAGAACFSLQNQVPAGANGTISCGDWSGCGSGANGRSWDYETCRYLVEPIGTNGVSDMFPARPWSLSWLRSHCAARFGVTPAPTALVDAWGFDADALVAQGASRILFTNGLNDGWSAGGFLADVSRAQDLLVLNMENGAHHSDLRHTRPCPAPDDTPDVLAARAEATKVLMRWLHEIKAEHATV